MRNSRKLVITALSFFVAVGTAWIAVSFPWDTDPQGDESKFGQSAGYYKKMYSSGRDSRTVATSGTIEPLSAKEQFYVDFARGEAKKAKIPEKLAEFVEKFDLAGRKVLEVGAGSGLLQDLVPDYTGLDISPTAHRFFHKPFVEASATDMPFPEGSFDALWSVWVLEHIPNPEKALLEMRRVVKPGGYLFLAPAFDVSRYAAQGYSVRPYSDFDWQGKLTKTTQSIVESNLLRRLQDRQNRALRSFSTRLNGGPSRLHFIGLKPNYDQYWVADSDATTSFSYWELLLWFTTRGDKCVSCPPDSHLKLVPGHDTGALVIQVNKGGVRQTAPPAARALP